MKQKDEQNLRQLFKNRSNCYADAEDVVQAMDEDCFIETIKEALVILDKPAKLKAEYPICGTTKFSSHSEGKICNNCKNVVWII